MGDILERTTVLGENPPCRLIGLALEMLPRMTRLRRRGKARRGRGIRGGGSA